MKKIFYIIIGFSLGFCSLVYGATVLFPSSGGTGWSYLTPNTVLLGNGYARLSTTTPTGLLDLMNLSPLTVGSITATSTTGTSQFQGFVNVGNPSGVFVDYFGGGYGHFTVEENVNDIAGINIGNISTGVLAGVCYDWYNANTLKNTAYGANKYFAASCFSGPNFAAFSGLPPNSLATIVSDGSMAWVTSTTTKALQTMAWGLGTGYTTANYDMVFTANNTTLTPKLGIGTSSPWAKLSVAGVAGSVGGLFTISSSTVSSTSTVLMIDSNGLVGIGTSTPYTQLSVQGGIAGQYFNADSSTRTSTFRGGLNVAGATGLNILQNGNVGVGNTSPSVKLHVSDGNSVNSSIITGTAPYFLASTQNQNLLSAVLVSSDTATHRPIFSGYRSRGTVSTPTAVINGDTLFSFLANGYDGSASQSPAQINFNVDSSVSSGNVPASISFVTGTNSTNRLDRMTISSGGNIGIGTTSPQWPFTSYSTGGPQLSLSAGAGIPQWTFRNAGGNLYLSTTTVAGTATTSDWALKIDGTTGMTSFHQPSAQLSANYTITASSTNIGVINFDSNDYINDGITHSITTNNATTTINYTGTYEIIPSWVYTTSSGADKTVELWLRVNNANVARSNTSLTNSDTKRKGMSVTFIYSFNAGDTFQIGMWGSDTTVQFPYVSTHVVGGETIPASPAVIMTIKRISQ